MGCKGRLFKKNTQREREKKGKNEGRPWEGNGKEISGGLKRLPNSSKALTLCGTSWVTERLRRGQLMQLSKLTTAAKAETPTIYPQHEALAWLQRLSYRVYCAIEIIVFSSWQLQKELNARDSFWRLREKHVLRFVSNVSAWISAQERLFTQPKSFLYKNKPIPWICLVRTRFGSK